VILYRIADILRGEDRNASLDTANSIYISIQTRASPFRGPSQVIKSISAMYDRNYSKETAAALLKESLQFINNHDEELKSKSM